MINKLRHWKNRIKDGALKEYKEALHWVYSRGKSETLFIIVYTLIGFSSAVVGLLSSLISRDLVDIITGHQTGKLIITLVWTIIITIVSTFVGQLSSYLSTMINLRIENKLKGEVFDDIMASDWQRLSEYRAGDLAMRWSGDIGVVSSGILSFIPNACIYTFRFASALYMVIKYDASFAIFALGSIPLSLWLSRLSIKRMQKENMSSMAMGSKISSFNQEAFGNIQTLKAFDMLPMYSKKLRALQKEYTETKLRYQKNAIVNAMIMMFLSMIVSYSAQGWGIYKVWSGAITYGTMTMFLSLSSQLTGTTNNLISLFPSTISLVNAAKRLRDITSMPKEDYSQREQVSEFYEKQAGDGVGLHLRNVVFSYDGSEAEVFSGANIDAFPRDVVALVGPSGEGKTTMLRILLALVKGSEGEGYLCGGNSLPEDGKCLPISASVRQLMAYVPQGNTMFYGTIAENMRNVDEDATDEEIIEALKMACAWEFVEKLPDGINTEIKERGGGFSEGQAQRLSIARALLRKSPILLLDEATSALDMNTERAILRNIQSSSYARTCIVTTHRPSVLHICNRVYAIRNKKCEVLKEEEIDRLVSDF